jgi:polyisoprenoid-binding protein YceI
MYRKLLTATLLTLTACSQHTAPTVQSPAADNSALAPAQTAVAASMTPSVPAGAYTLDKSHASLIFHVDHLGFSKYKAQFKVFTADLQFDSSHPEAAAISASIDVASLDLINPPTGFVETLIGEQWLNAKQFPVITFKSTKVDVTGNNTMTVTGDFTLHGVTKPVALDVVFNGGYAGHPMDPHARIGFSAQGAFKRSDFGITFGIPAAGTTMGVSDAVEVLIEAEFSGPAFTRLAKQ